MANTLVRGKLMHPDSDRPWLNAPIDITFYGYSQTATEQRPSDRLSVKTATDGTWSVSLWKNADGDYQSYYLFRFAGKHDQPIKVYLPAGTPPEIEFSQLAIASTPPSDPSYPSLIALINTMFAAGDFFPAGGALGQVLAIAQTSPRSFEWVDKAQGSDLKKPAAVALSGHKVVFIAADGARYASNAEASHAGIAAGITLGAVAPNAEATIRTKGELTEPSWNWIVSTPVFLGVDGGLIQGGVGPPAKFSQVVGIAIAPTTVLIDLKSPIVLG